MLHASWLNAGEDFYLPAVGVPGRMVAAAVLSPEGTAACVLTGAGMLTEATGTTVGATATAVTVGAAPPVSHALKRAAEPNKSRAERVRAGLRREKIKVESSFQIWLPR